MAESAAVEDGRTGLDPSVDLTTAGSPRLGVLWASFPESHQGVQSSQMDPEVFTQ